MAVKNGMGPERRSMGVEFTESAFQEFMRAPSEEPKDVESEEAVNYMTEKEEKPSRHEEAEVVTEGEPGDTAPRETLGDENVQRVKEGEAAEEEDKSTDLSRALATIDRLATENTRLRTERPAEGLTVKGVRGDDIEMQEIAPGIHLPKDRGQWPIQLTPDIVKAVGIDPGEDGSIAAGLNALANVLVYEIVGKMTPRIAREEARRVSEGRVETEREENLFFGTFTDLKDKRDLLGIVERRLQADIQAGRRAYQNRDEYMNDLAKETRTRVADLRGQSYDDYMGSVGARRNGASNGSQRTTRTSRAVTTSGSRSSRSTGGTRSDMDDMIDNA